MFAASVDIEEGSRIMIIAANSCLGQHYCFLKNTSAVVGSCILGILDNLNYFLHQTAATVEV